MHFQLCAMQTRSAPIRHQGNYSAASTSEHCALLVMKRRMEMRWEATNRESIQNCVQRGSFKNRVLNPPPTRASMKTPRLPGFSRCSYLVIEANRLPYCLEVHNRTRSRKVSGCSLRHHAHDEPLRSQRALLLLPLLLPLHCIPMPRQPCAKSMPLDYHERGIAHLSDWDSLEASRLGFRP